MAPSPSTDDQSRSSGQPTATKTTGTSMFSCPEPGCSKEFTSQGSLARHLHNHSQSARHACSVCGVVFRRRDLLTRHLKLHVPGDGASITAAEDDAPPAVESTATASGTVSRKRCHTACNRCRDLKIKCDGQKPCARCRSARKQCDVDRHSSRISKMTGAATGGGAGRRTSSSIAASVSSPNAVVVAATAATAADDAAMSLDSLSPSAADIPPDDDHPGGDAQGNGQYAPFVDAILSWDPAMPDIVPWPWIHESLFLSSDNPALFNPLGSTDLPFTGDHLAGQPLAGTDDYAGPDGMHVDGVTNAFISMGDEGSAVQGLTTVAPAFPAGRHPLITSSVGVPGPISPPVDDIGHAGAGAAAAPQVLDATVLKHRAVEDLVTVARSTGLAPSRQDSTELWATTRPDLASLFGLTTEATTSPLGSAPAVMSHLLGLYKEHFHPLWPLLRRRSLDTGEMHPLLYLVLASIGAMYMGRAGSELGAMLHNAVRRQLVLPLELDETDDSLVWLAQARLLTQVSALYFGQPRAFSYAQHLGPLLAAQARKMCLFSASRHKHGVRQFAQLKGVAPDAERLRVWFAIEERRRLAFGIFRGDTYTSILLNTKPLVTLDEIGLEFPGCDSVWMGGDNLDPRLALEMIEHDRTPSRDPLASDVYHILLERDEMLPPLEPVAHEILLFGLQLLVWRFSRDRQVLEGLTGGRGFFEGEDSEDDNDDDDSDDRLPPPPKRRRRHRRDTFASEAESLDRRSYRMADLFAERRRLATALSKWERALPLAKTFARSERDRSYVLSSLILYHLSFLRLYAPVEDIHQLHYRLADRRCVSADLVAGIRAWTRSAKARVAVERVRSVWSLITQQTQLGRAKSKFNFNAFVGLHHGAAILWAYSGARDQEEDAAGGDSANSGVGSSPTFSLRAGGQESREILKSFADLFHKISPARWSSFAEVTEVMCTLDFPKTT